MQRELSAVFHGNALDLEFVDCYGQHLAWLETWFQRRLSCNGVASELAQEVFLKLYEQREQILGLRQPKAWLTTVAHGLLVNHYRRADLERAYLAALAVYPTTHVPDPEQKAVLFETLLELDRSLRQLPNKVRQAFLMVQLEGVKQQDIARELGVSLSMVKKYIAQAQQCCGGGEDYAQRLSHLNSEQRALSSRTLAALPRLNRRAILKSVCVLLGAGGFFHAYRKSDYSADWVSAKGEVRTQTLPDGSELTLDSDSAVELVFTPAQKLIVLRRGRIMIQTASTLLPNELKPVVRTREGFAQAMGTVFSVEQKAQSTQVEVFEQRVQWRSLSSGFFHLLNAGEQAEFNQRGLLSSQSVSQERAAWTRGLYVADAVPLKKWATEISRYRAAGIHCDVAVENWLVSGTFPLNKPEIALLALQDALPVQLIQHNTLAASPVLLVARERGE